MSRNRKPLSMQNGNLTVEMQIKKQAEEEIVTVGREQLTRAPTWLVDSAAKKEFRRIIKEFKKVDVVGNLDLNNLGGYCNAYSFYLKATDQLKKEPLIINKPLPNGAEIKAGNPLIRIQKNYAEEMRKFASLCGLTIDSRLKFATSQISKTDQQIDREFGDI